MLGFVGLGSMGMPIAKNILKADIPLKFFAHRSPVIEAVTQFGAHFCVTLEELGAQCDTILFFLKTADQCETCLKKILTQMKAGGVIIIGSTILPEDSLQLGRLCAEQGVDLLDAPVSGGTQGAEDGSLTIIVSGKRERAEQSWSLMKHYGNKIVYVGEKPGYAQILKAINQELVGINIASVCEAYALGIKCGLDPNIIFETISTCAGTSRIFENRSQFIIERNFDKRSSLQIHHKDLQICQRLADKVGMRLPLANLCDELYQRAMSFCDPEEDGIALIKLLEQNGN